jgi:hypothetical protein
VLSNEYKKIDKSLRDIIKIGRHIFHYELGSAPFFLVYVHDPKGLCAYFESHKISIRDKSAEIKFAVRISISIPPVNNTVIELLKQYNNRSFAKTNYIDLDNTLRNGSSHDSKLFSTSIQMLDKMNAAIITNNVDFTKNKLVSQTGLTNYNFITPIESMKILLDSHQHIPYIVGTDSIKEYLGHVIGKNIDDYTIFVVCGDLFEGDINTLAERKAILNRLKKIYLFEHFESGHISKCSNNPINIDVDVPYFGKYLKLIEFTGEIINFGKNSYRDENFGIMIGDTLETDGQMCFDNNGLYIHILKDDSALKWNGKYFTVGNIDILHNSIS